MMRNLRVQDLMSKAIPKNGVEFKLNKTVTEYERATKW